MASKLKKFGLAAKQTIILFGNWGKLIGVHRVVLTAECSKSGGCLLVYF